MHDGKRGPLHPSAICKGQGLPHRPARVLTLCPPHSPMWACRVVVAVEWASLLASKEDRMYGYLLNTSLSFNFSLTTLRKLPQSK